MFANYIKIAFRNLFRNKVYSLINILGLATGMAGCVLVTFWVVQELSFDRFHKNSDRIYRVCLDAFVGAPMNAPVVCAPAGPAMEAEFPEVEKAVRIIRPQSMTVTYNDQQFQQEGITYTDEGFFDVFSFNLLNGNPATALSAPNSLVITEAMAEKYFGNSDPISATLTINGDREYMITGVMRNMPDNSHLQYNMLLSFKALESLRGAELQQWIAMRYYTYLLLTENTDVPALEAKFDQLITASLGPVLNAIGGKMRFYLQPLTDIHLYSDFAVDIQQPGDISYVYLFSGVALLLLLIAGFNFINLTTARAIRRAREVGLRKTLGAQKTNLVLQFLGESIFLSLLAVIIAGLLIELALPIFNSLTGYNFTIDFFTSWWTIPALFALALGTGILAGMYPAVVLSSYRPVSVLKGLREGSRRRLTFRRMLVLFQFLVSAILIVATLTIRQQLSYARNIKLGYAKDRILVIPENPAQSADDLHILKAELRQVPGVVNAAATSMVPGRGMFKGAVQPEGFTIDQSQTVDILIVDADFLDLMEVEFTAGRNFSTTLASDTSQSVIINQTAARKFGWDEPIGKEFLNPPVPGQADGAPPSIVVGVVKDFHLHSVHSLIDPLLVTFDYSQLANLVLKVDTENIQGTMAALKDKWNDLYPGTTMNSFFFDEFYNSLYQNEERLGTLMIDFSILAIFIGCLGLFGMSAYSAENRTKEIGVRKVLGATEIGIVNLLAREFIYLILIANLLAWPLAWYFLKKWLSNFAYHIDFGLLIFFQALLIVTLITLITVSFQAIKAALANPVESLRYE